MSDTHELVPFPNSEQAPLRLHDKINLPQFDRSFIRMARHVPNGEELVLEQAGFHFDLHHGDQIEILTREREELDKRYEHSEKVIEALEDKARNTDRYIQIPNVINGDGGDVPFPQWNLRDQIVFFFAILMALVALAMGVANVAINLQESGIPTFIENPWMPYLLAMILPGGAMALKFVSNFLDHDRRRRQYAWAIYFLCGISVLAWVSLFSVQFHSVSSGGIDWDSLGESNSSELLSTLFVASQILSEIFIGAALFLVADHIAARYSQHYYVQNLEWVELKKALSAHIETHRTLRQIRNQRHGQLVTLHVARKAYVSEMLLEFSSFEVSS